MSPHMPLLVRFFSKLLLDILPAALASVIGGLLFAHYDWSQIRARVPVAERAAPASPEMMQLVRDEHAAMASYLKAQVTAEKDRLDAEDAAAAEAAGHPATTAAVMTPGGATVAAVESKPLVPPVQEPAHVQVAAAPATPSPQTPLVIAQAEPGDGALPPADNPNPLLAGDDQRQGSRGRHHATRLRRDRRHSVLDHCAWRTDQRAGCEFFAHRPIGRRARLAAAGALRR